MILTLGLIAGMMMQVKQTAPKHEGDKMITGDGQTYEVTPPVDPGIGAPSQFFMTPDSVFAHIDNAANPNTPGVVVIDGGLSQEVRVPKGSYVVVITPPAQLIQQASGTVIPRSGEGQPAHPDLADHSGTTIAPIWQTGKCLLSDGSQIDCPAGGAPPPKPTYTTAIDKRFGIVMMTAACPAHYIVDFATPKTASIVDEQSNLELFLNATCSEYTTVPKDDPIWNAVNRFTFSIDFHHWMDVWAKEYSNQKRGK